MDKVLSSEKLLDKILSFFPAGELKGLRLVSHFWNDRILENFEKRLKLCTWDPSVDPRLFKSVSLSEGSTTTLQLRTLGASFALISLQISFSGPFLDSFISVINGGGFLTLRDLKIIYCDEDAEEGVEEDATGELELRETTLPNLQSFKCFLKNPGRLLNSRKLQSFVSAAPHLISISTNAYLDLSSLEETTSLYLDYATPFLTPKLIQRMLTQVAEKLRTFTLTGVCSAPPLQLPILKELQVLDVQMKGAFSPYPACFQKEWNLSSLTTPKLQFLRIPFRCVPWHSTLKLFQSVWKVELTHVPHPQHQQQELLIMDAMRQVLNALSVRVSFTGSFSGFDYFMAIIRRLGNLNLETSRRNSRNIQLLNVTAEHFSGNYIIEEVKEAFRILHPICDSVLISFSQGSVRLEPKNTPLVMGNLENKNMVVSNENSVLFK